MRILYDGQIYALHPTGGICRYFTNLISKLPANFIPSLITCQNFKIYYPTHPNLKIYKRLNFRPSRVSYWLERPYLRGVTTLGRFDIAHPTYYSLFTQQKISNYRCPLVLTVHDMIHERFPKQINISDRTIDEKRKAIFSAQKLICVSQNTKNDLLERYPEVEKKVKVIYHASDIDVTISYGLESVPLKPYYLYVGSRNSYKNFYSLLAAFSKAVSIQSELILCVVGSPLTEAEKKQIANLNLTNYIEHYPYPSDRHLAKLYRCSLALVYPSLYEGFGIPPLEAMSCGTPVVASNRSSIPEVVGDAGILFNPDSVSDLTDSLLFLFDNPIERDRLIAKGLERAKAFSWDKTVSQTLEVYYSLVN